MDFKQIQYFVQVAELGSFTRAATVLRVAQPALSRQVRSLEVELRQNLFDRNGRGVTLTAAGTRLLAHGRGILQQLERARLDLEVQRGQASGLVSIGLAPSIGRSITAPLVEVFRQQLPGATLSVVEGLSANMLDWLVQGRIDCAVVYNATPAAAIALTPVLQEPLYLVSARAKQRGTPLLGPPITLAQLAAVELVIPSRPHAIRMQLETALAQAGLGLKVALEIESVPAMLDLVQRHPLHALLSLNAVTSSGAQAALSVRPVHVGKNRDFSASLWLATSAQRPRGPLLDQACGMLLGLLRATLGN
jgi:LysR family transcriptional regulator, nitrogen assimilation regulatory protein